MSKIRTSLIPLLLFFLIGCASPKFLNINQVAKPSIPTIETNKSLFYKDGRQAYYFKCDGPSWSECNELAGNACKNKGYDILEKNTVKIPSLFVSDKIQNELYIACKVIEDEPKKVSNSTN